MSGWTRLGLVLSAIYWLGVGGLVVLEVNMNASVAPGFGPAWQVPIWPIPVAAAVFYAICAALVWALRGFARRE